MWWCQVEARADVDVPERLIAEEHIQKLVEERQPHYVQGGDHALSLGADSGPPSDDPSEGIMQFRLSNGIRINARRTTNEPKAAMLRMIAAGNTAACLQTLPSSAAW